MVVNQRLWQWLKEKTLEKVSVVLAGSGANTYFTNTFPTAIIKVEVPGFQNFLEEFESCFKIACLYHNFEIGETEARFKTALSDILGEMERRARIALKTARDDSDIRRKRNEIVGRRVLEAQQKFLEAKNAEERIMQM
jgi:hypothetical protein